MIYGPSAPRLDPPRLGASCPGCWMEPSDHPYGLCPEWVAAFDKIMSRRRRAPLWPLLAFVFVVALLASTLTLVGSALSSNHSEGISSGGLASTISEVGVDGSAVLAIAPTQEAIPALITPAFHAAPVDRAHLSSVEDIPAIITAAGIEFGVDPGWLQRVAFCESSYRTWVVGDAGASVGLFQIQTAFWWENAPRIGYTTDLRLDPVASSRVAAYSFSVGKAGAWTCRG